MNSAASIRVGTAGWSYKDWDGILYPPEVTRKKIHPVEYLARFFDVIEINTSFYGHIRPEWGRLWCKRAAAVNPNFRFHRQAASIIHAFAASRDGTHFRGQHPSQR